MTDAEPATGSSRRALGFALVLTVPAAALLASVSMADIALNALVGLGTLAACALAGAPVARWLALPGLDPTERALVALAGGMTLLGLVLLGLGAIGFLRPWTVLGTTGAAAVAGALYARPWTAVAAVRDDVVGVFDGFDGALLVVALFLVLTELLAVSAVPVWDWDSLMYHLPVPDLWLREGRIFQPPAQTHAAFAGLVHLLYTIPLAAGRAGGVVVLSGLLALALAVGLGRFVERESDPATGRLAIAGLAGTSVIFFVAVTPRIDVTLAFLLLLTHWAVLQAARGRSPRWLLAAALFAGAAMGTKLHAAAYLLPLASWCFWLWIRRRVPARIFLAAAAIAVLVTAPWLVKNALLVGDPIHPLLSGPAFPGWLMEKPAVAAASGRVRTDLIALSRAPIGLRDLLLAPGRLSPEPDAYYYVWSPVLVLGLLVALASPGTWRWGVPALAYLAILLLRSERTNLRYLIPAVPALAGASALALRGVLPWPRVRRWLLGALFAVSLAFLVVPLRTVSRWVRYPGGGSPYYSIYAAAAEVSRRVPPDGLVLMLYEGRSWPFDRPVLQDNLALTWPLLAESGQAASCLRELGTPITHVLINAGALAFYSRGDRGAQHVSDGALTRFVDRCLTDETVVGPFLLYSLRTPERPDATGSGTGP